MNEITGKCIWITGASSGLGYELVQKLAQAGNYIIISARNSEKLTSIAEKDPDRIRVLPFDVSDTQGLSEVKSDLRTLTDYLDIVICAAGIAAYEDDLRFEPAMYENVFNTNFLGVVRTLNVALPFLRRSESRPHFVGVGSLSSLVGFPRAQAYGSSKAALEYFFRSLKADFAKLPIDVTLVRPGFISTSMVDDNDFPMPFIMTPEQAADRLIDGLETRKFIVDFPKRLSIPLRVAGSLFGLWCRFVAPKVTRLKQFRMADTQS